MNFSWKVFFSTLIVIMITFSIGGYLLITALFTSSYKQEVNNAKGENAILQTSLATALSALSGYDNKIEETTIAEISRSLVKGMNGEHIWVRVSNQDYKLIYQSEEIPFGNELLKSITARLLGYTLLSAGENYYIQTACLIDLAGQSIYLESFHNISPIYQNRKELYNVYKRLLTVLLIVNGVISYLISLWLTYPIKKVSRVAHRISRGSLNHRVKIHSKDEIGRLAQDFNTMTDSLESKIHELEDMTRRQEDFIGSFAHELKTPLTSIIGYADILRSNIITPEMTVMSANYIFKEGLRLEALSLKLLELIVMKKQELELKKVSVARLLNEIMGFVSPVMALEEIRIKIDAEDVNLMLEPDLIKTVLINLIDNGKKAIEGAGTISLFGRREQDGGYSIFVKDTGKGIPEEELKKITEAFYMVDKSRAREQGGAGLGLAICDEIMKRHAGTMTFYSTVGKGTTVHLYFRKESVYDKTV